MPRQNEASGARGGPTIDAAPACGDAIGRPLVEDADRALSVRRPTFHGDRDPAREGRGRTVMSSGNLPARHTQRWRGHDYADCGAYFVTICTHDRICRFGSIRDGVLDHNDLGRIAGETWASLAARFPGVRAGTHVVMPNHVHGILTLSSAARTNLARSRIAIGGMPRDRPRVVRLPEIVGAFKSIVAVEWTRRETRAGLPPPGRLWQRNYWDRVLRDAEEVSRAAAYIEGNVANWATDPIRPEPTP